MLKEERNKTIKGTRFFVCHLACGIVMDRFAVQDQHPLDQAFVDMNMITAIILPPCLHYHLPRQ